MWRLEKDPHLASTFGTVSILDRAPDFDTLRARMERRRDRGAPAALARAARTRPTSDRGCGPTIPTSTSTCTCAAVALPKPGTRRELLDLASVMLLDPLDRTRPLWQFTVVEGLRGGKAALLSKMHHTITDGEGGVRMSMQYLDLERNAAAATSGGRPAHRRRAVDAAHALGARHRPRSARGQLPHPVEPRPPGARAARRPGVDPARAQRPRSTPLRSIVSQLSETDAARSPLWTEALACAAASRRPGCRSPRPRTRRSASVARSTPPSSPPPPRLPAAITASAGSRSTSCGRRWP